MAKEKSPYSLKGSAPWTDEQGKPDPYSDKSRALIDVDGETKHLRIGDYLPGGGSITKIGEKEIWAIPDDPDGGPEYRVGMSSPKPSLREETRAKAKELWDSHQLKELGASKHFQASSWMQARKASEEARKASEEALLSIGEILPDDKGSSPFDDSLAASKEVQESSTVLAHALGAGGFLAEQLPGMDSSNFTLSGVTLDSPHTPTHLYFDDENGDTWEVGVLGPNEYEVNQTKDSDQG